MADITIEVYCECGRLLGSSPMRNNNIEVEPCPDCAKESFNEGYDKGYDKGRETE